MGSSQALHTVEDWRRSMLDRVAVFTASPAAAFLALLLELLLGLGVGETKVELDTGVISCDTVEVLDDSFSNFTGFEAGFEVSESNDEGGTDAYRAKPTSLLTPDGLSRQILVETAWNGKKCLQRSCSGQQCSILLDEIAHTASFQSMGTPVQ